MYIRYQNKCIVVVVIVVVVVVVVVIIVVYLSPTVAWRWSHCPVVALQPCGHSIVPSAFQFVGPKEWNNLPLLIRKSLSIYIFKSRLKTYLFNCAFKK